MANKKNVGKRKILCERIQEIENYLLGINTLVNPNMKDVVKRNPIAVKSAGEILRVLQEELEEYHLDINEVNLEAIYDKGTRSQEDSFICNLSDGIVKAMVEAKYKAMVQGEELEQLYPTSKRKTRITELQERIKKENQIIETLEKIDPSLAKDNKKEIYKLQREIDGIEETLFLPTRECVRLELYSAASYKLDNLREQCKHKLAYLEGISA